MEKLCAQDVVRRADAARVLRELKNAYDKLPRTKQVNVQVAIRVALAGNVGEA